VSSITAPSETACQKSLKSAGYRTLASERFGADRAMNEVFDYVCVVSTGPGSQLAAIQAGLSANVLTKADGPYLGSLQFGYTG
jgi:hypothetical protein